MIRISKKLIKRFPTIDLVKLESFSDEHQKRFYRRLESGSEGVDLSRNGIMFLLCSLQRSKILYNGLVQCLNNPAVTLAYLALRAHMETTGSVAYFLKKLRQYYEGDFSSEKMDDTLYRLILGRRVYPNDHSTIKSHPTNVLTLVDAVDNVFSKMAKFPGGKRFRETYEWLSEFCHPNCFGQTIGVEISLPKAIFEEEPEFREHNVGQINSYMIISCELFFDFYDKCFSLVEENEEMPKLIRVSR